MPCPDVQLLKSAAKNKFRLFNIQLPTVEGGSGGTLSHPVSGERAASSPSGALAAGRAMSIGSSSQASQGQQTATPLTMPPALFRAASNSVADVNMQRQLSTQFSDFIDGICNAIISAWNDWKMKASLEGVRIDAAIATGGTVAAPSFDSLIWAHAPHSPGWESDLSTAIAKGLGMCWDNWRRSVSVPGLPWYPAFVAFPGPKAPPMPNVPTPLAMLRQDVTRLAPSQVKSVMLNCRRQPHAYSLELFDAIASAVSAAFLQWLPSQQVMLVMGRGPIPTFAPPYVPVGPVVGGDVVTPNYPFLS